MEQEGCEKLTPNIMVYNVIIITRTLFMLFYCPRRYNNLMTNVVPNILN